MQLGVRGVSKKVFFTFPEIKFWKNCKFAELSNFSFQNRKKYYFTDTSDTHKNIYTYYSMHCKIQWDYQGGEGGVKKSLFGFQKINFDNSAKCRIIKILFPRTKKEQFLSTLSTPAKRICLLFNTLQNNRNKFKWLKRRLTISRNQTNKSLGKH